MRPALLFPLLMIVLLLAPALAQAGATAPAVVPHVDIKRYAGRWYEVARMPMFFQRHCAGNTTAEYTPLPSGELKVLNQCDADNSMDPLVAEGRARVEDTATNAKLRVTFAHFFGGWRYLFGGDYWVIDLDPAYQWAVVGHPSHRYGWILSRRPGLPLETLRKITERLEVQGYDPCKFTTTIQPGGFQAEAKLCEVVRDEGSYD